MLEFLNNSSYIDDVIDDIFDEESADIEPNVDASEVEEIRSDLENLTKRATAAGVSVVASLDGHTAVVVQGVSSGSAELG